MALRKWIRAMVVLTVIIGFLCTPLVVGAEEEDNPTGTEIIIDLAVARPLGFVSLAAGTSVFIVSLPFALVAGSVRDTADALVGEPYRFTFIRDLGKY